jgi:hypothetical protein
MSNDEFGAPASSEGIQWADLKGSLLMFDVHEVIPEMDTQFGTSSAVRATVTVLDGEKAGEVVTDTLVFPKVLQSQIKSRVGGKVLGRLGQGEAKKGQSAPWKLSEATEADKTVARAHIAKVTEAPF